MFFSFSLKPYLKIAGLLFGLMSLVWLDGNAQLLEDGQNKLKTVKTKSRGFLFFGRKIKSADSKDFRGSDKKVQIRSAAPASYNRKEQGVKVRYSKSTKETFYSALISRQLKSKGRIGPPGDAGTLFGKSKFSFFPSLRSREKRPVVRSSAPVSYNRKEHLVKVRYSRPVKDNFYSTFTGKQLKSKRRIGPSGDASRLYGKGKFSIRLPLIFPMPLSISGKMSFSGFDRRIAEQFRPINVTNTYQGDIKQQHRKSKTRIGPPGDASTLFGKGKFSIKLPMIFPVPLSISGKMNFSGYDRRLAEQFRPINVTNTYQGDIKRQHPFLEDIRYRMGQWKRSSYKGHHVSWNKFGKQAYLKGSNNLMANHQGKMKVPIPFLDNLYKKMGNWEQTHYQGRSDGWSKFGNKAYLKGNSTLMSNYEGDIKVKKRKGGDMHPSIAYISGKKFKSNNWKERWRKLNILWVRLNPGKEVPDGPKQKVKVKYDKEERDLWTY